MARQACQIAGRENGRELLTEAYVLLQRGPFTAEGHAPRATGALLIDIRGDDQRRAGRRRARLTARPL